MVLLLRRGCDQHGLPVKFLIHTCSTQITKLHVLSLIKCWEEANSLQKTHSVIWLAASSEKEKYYVCTCVWMYQAGWLIWRRAVHHHQVFLYSQQLHTPKIIYHTQTQNKWLSQMARNRVNDTGSKVNKKSEPKQSYLILAHPVRTLVWVFLWFFQLRKLPRRTDGTKITNS